MLYLTNNFMKQNIRISRKIQFAKTDSRSNLKICLLM